MDLAYFNLATIGIEKLKDWQKTTKHIDSSIEDVDTDIDV